MRAQAAVAALLDRPALQKIFAAFAGVELRVVGGAVRNALLGEPVADLDLAIAAPPDVTLARAAAAELKAVPTGYEHGTITLVIEGAPFELTSLRADVETDGRRAKVVFGGSFEQDAHRRDFTVNALSVDAAGRLFDYVGGLADLEARRIRFIGDPRQRIAEDFLRILRFFRFSARYGDGPPEPAGFAACIASRDGLRGLSRERLGGELLKMLGHPGSAPMIGVMSRAGLLEFLTLAPWPARLQRLAARQAVAQAPDALLALAALALHSATDAARLAEALRLSRAQKKRLEAMGAVEAALHGVLLAPQVDVLRRLAYRHDIEATRDGLDLLRARRTSEDPREEAMRDRALAQAQEILRETPRPRPPFSARDLLRRGLAPGERLGLSLKALEAAWIAAGFPDDEERIAGLIDSIVKPT